MWAWLMNGPSIRSAVHLATPNANRAIEAVGDFDGDAKADLLWRNHSTSETVLWRMSGGAIASTAWLAAPSSEWDLQAATDFDGDGRCDAMWRNTATGENVVWLMNGTAIANAAYRPPIPSWRGTWCRGRYFSARGSP